MTDFAGLARQEKKGTARKKQKIRGAKENKHVQSQVWGRIKIRMGLDDGDFKTGMGNDNDENQGQLSVCQKQET